MILSNGVRNVEFFIFKTLNTLHNREFNKLSFFSSGYLDLVSPKHMLRAENNPWIKEIADQLVLGTSHVLTYLRTTGENGYEG